MNALFVDTSAWYAIVDKDDSDDKAAVLFLSCSSIPLITTNAVFSETITLIPRSLMRGSSFNLLVALYR